MENISLVAQIIAVADVYHAMTSERIYRARASSFKVLEMIKEEEFGKYNIEAVNALISLVCDFTNIHSSEIIRWRARRDYLYP